MQKYSITADQLQVMGTQLGKCKLQHALAIVDIIRALPVTEEQIPKEEFFKLKAELDALKKENEDLKIALTPYQSRDIKTTCTLVPAVDKLSNADSIPV
jgi:hypothetical protein